MLPQRVILTITLWRHRVCQLEYFHFLFFFVSFLFILFYSIHKVLLVDFGSLTGRKSDGGDMDAVCESSSSISYMLTYVQLFSSFSYWLLLSFYSSLYFSYISFAFILIFLPLSIYLSISLSPSFNLSIYSSIYPSIYLSISLSFSPSNTLTITVIVTAMISFFHFFFIFLLNFSWIKLFNLYFSTLKFHSDPGSARIISWGTNE